MEFVIAGVTILFAIILIRGVVKIVFKDDKRREK